MSNPIRPGTKVSAHSSLSAAAAVSPEVVSAAVQRRRLSARTCTRVRPCHTPAPCHADDRTEQVHHGGRKAPWCPSQPTRPQGGLPPALDQHGRLWPASELCREGLAGRLGSFSLAKLADLSVAPGATWKCRGSVNGRFAGPGATLGHGSLPAGSDGAPLWPGGQRGEQSHALPGTAETAGLRSRTGWRAGTAESPPHPPLRVVRPETL